MSGKRRAGISRSFSWRLPVVLLPLVGSAALALLVLLIAMQRPVAIRIAPDSAAFNHASTGWLDGERTKDGIAFRWTSDESLLIFRAARRTLPANRPLLLQMTFSGRPPGSPVAPVTLRANGRVIDTWSSDTEHPVAIDVAPLLRRHDELHLVVTTDPFSPPRDKRQLGVALVGEARIGAAKGWALPAPDAAASAIVLAMLAVLAVGRRAPLRWRYLAAGVMAGVIFIGVMLARMAFWRLVLPLELLLGGIVIARWAPEWWAALSWPVVMARRRLALDRRWLLLGGGAIAVVGQSVIALHRGTALGVVLLALGLVVLIVGCAPDSRTASPPSEAGYAVTDDDAAREESFAPPRARVDMGRWQVVTLVAVAALAVAMRCAILTDMPASLFRDEARHALTAIHILDDSGYRPVYEPEIALPTLFLYALALWFKLFGISLLTLRLFMALAGVGGVLLLFLLGQRLFGTRIGLIAAYLFAISFWALRMQRVALAPCFSTGLVLLALWLFVRAVQERRWWDWALAGVGAAGTVYCYHSGPFALVLMALVALVLLIRAPRHFLRFWLPRCLLFTAIFLILAAPLLRYVATHFEEYLARPRQTAIFSEENLRRLGQDRLAAFEANILPNIGMYTVRGDREAKANLPFAPHLDAIMAVLFLLGLALALSGWLFRAPYGLPRFGIWFVLGYLGVMLIPAILAIDAPSTLRAFDTLPPALLLVALGIDAIWVRLSPTIPSLVSPARGYSARAERWVIGAIAVILASVLLLNGGTYFWRMRTDRRETLRFDTYFASQAGKWMVDTAHRSPGMTFYVPRQEIDRDVFPFFARVAGTAPLLPLEAANPNALPPRYAILLPNGADVTPPAWARGLVHVDGTAPAGAGGVPAFVVYETPGISASGAAPDRT